MSTPTWYSVAIEVANGEDWRLMGNPWTQVTDGSADDLAEYVVESHDLRELEQRWRVRVFAGYNRYEDLVCERVSPVRSR